MERLGDVKQKMESFEQEEFHFDAVVFIFYTIFCHVFILSNFIYIWCFCVGLAAVREIKGGWRGGMNFLAKRLIKTLFKKKLMRRIK